MDQIEQARIDYQKEKDKKYRNFKLMLLQEERRWAAYYRLESPHRRGRKHGKRGEYIQKEKKKK